jgi:predicted ATPase/DNA-binding SARP family transcriptional activator
VTLLQTNQTNQSKMTSPLSVTLFGPMQVQVNGQPLPPLRSRKSLWLLALLILRPHRSLEREWLSGVLWPEVDQSVAFRNLRVILSELRRALGTAGERLQSPRRDTLRFDLAGADVDLLIFDSAITSPRLETLVEAITLYSGPLLEGCPEEWVVPERRQREQSCLRALQVLTEAAFAAGDLAAVIGYCQRSVSIDPWNEAARRGWMQALAQGGNTNAALQVYREFAERLKSERHTLPDEQTTTLYQRLRSPGRPRVGESVRVPAETATIPVITGSLPHPLTELVGREDECLEVASRLRRSRLVTLTGPGGIGKTRLAVAVASEIVGEYADGAWLVALESVPSESRVDSQVAQVLGMADTSDPHLRDRITEHLKTKRLLLVLDNCEQVLTASAGLAEHLLRACAGVRILATSREALGISGEVVWAVPCLAVPELQTLPEAPTTLLRVLMGYESVRLFVERAQSARRSFSLTENNALAVASICSWLDGLPLAIELAAARVTVLTAAQIAERLQDHLSGSLTLLTGGNRTPVGRQQTLRATLDWSEKLLNEKERVLLRRLSVFTSGWTLSAAESICADDNNGIRPDQILSLLRSLVEKSLVVFEEREPETEGRYRLLEMVRQYAAERLEMSGETEQVRAKQRDWFVAFAEASVAGRNGPDTDLWLERLEAEHDNLRSVLQHLPQDTDGSQPGLCLARSLWGFWERRGHFTEGRRHLERMLARSDAQALTPVRAAALQAAGRSCYKQGDYEAAQRFSDEALATYRHLNHTKGIADALVSRANIDVIQGKYPLAKARYEEGIELLRGLGDQHSIALSLHNLAKVSEHLGDNSRSAALYEESLQIRRAIGDKHGIAAAVRGLGDQAMNRGDYALSQVYYEECLQLRRELGHQHGIACGLSSLGVLAVIQGDYPLALALHEEALRINQKLGDKHSVGLSLGNLAEVAYSRGDYTTAIPLYEESLCLRREVGDQGGVAWILANYGRAVREHGDARKAHALYRESLLLFRELEDRDGIAHGLSGFAALLLSENKVPEGVRLLGTAAALREIVGIVQEPRDRRELDEQCAVARVALGEDAFGRAWAEGGALSWQGAVVLALVEVEWPETLTPLPPLPQAGRGGV